MFARISPAVAAVALTRRGLITGPNDLLIAKLRADLKREQLEEKVSLTRHKSLLSAIEVITHLDYQVTTTEMVGNLPGVGPATARRIQEHLPSHCEVSAPVCLSAHNVLTKYLVLDSERLPKAKLDSIVEELTTIDGMTKNRAQRLITAGCRNKQELLLPQYFNILPLALQANVRHASHLERPVPRSQTETVAEFLRESLGSKYDIIPIGSYRRGAAQSSCVRLFLTNSDHVNPHPPPAPPPGAFKPNRSETLKAPGFLRNFPLHNTVAPKLEDLALSVSARLCTYQNWNGVLRIPEQKHDGRWETLAERRSAMRLGSGDYVLCRLFMLPSKSRGAALICLTGSKGFVKLVARKAEKLGMYLFPTGLWRWHPDESELDVVPMEDTSNGKEDERKAKGFWQLLPSTEEDMIFEQLQMEYVQPEKRGTTYTE
ncbi:hypothetical protein C0991_010971 [Blastosporella zonata]|nr:hypothetical protein C0991_010971 [Blastosporella zonata]